ncbi:MAG: sterol desaturase family protein [Flavobacteriales bacterium]|mgnify:CR=1 FL=1|nr:sterol desaturase family protein [Flavobacteriales bacterium]MBP6641446.1 sterol desaturase family protein [Flavobacteriales bacterium]MBP7155344.1 sterol desaturase family protein [Flavobacteriales bacterium]HQV74313.1 sterol desaturase family protein [Flavobacteriales bacterium]HQW40115.1 sterol desaturase family protein [Flavobacteriales bacterium]
MDAIALAIPFFFLLIGVELAWSAWTHRKVYRFNDFISNLGCGIGSQIVGAFSKAFIFAAYLLVFDRFRVFNMENSAITWITAFLLVDLLYYWFHRLSHEVNFLWAAHIVHHQSEEYNLSVALRQSWFQGLFSWWFYVPLAFLGFHPLVILTVAAVNTLYQFWIHTKAVDRMGPFEWLFNTPSHHRVHHGSDPKYLDRNHAGTLIIWDKLFGTFQAEVEEPTYGITTPLGTWDPMWANFHYWGELVTMAKRTSTWTDRMRVFLKSPGWRPQELGGPSIPVEWDRHTYTKFDTQLPNSWSSYIGFQFVILLIVSSYFLFQQQLLSVALQWSLGVLIVWWVMDLGALLEGRKWALIAEFVRTLVLIGLLFWLPLTIATYTMIAVTIALLVPIPFLFHGTKSDQRERSEG